MLINQRALVQSRYSKKKKEKKKKKRTKIYQGRYGNPIIQKKMHNGNRTPISHKVDGD